MHYLVDQCQYYLVIGYVKTVAILKYHQFEKSKSNKTEPRKLKR